MSHPQRPVLPSPGQALTPSRMALEPETLDSRPKPPDQPILVTPPGDLLAEALRLVEAGVTQRQASRRLGIPRSTLRDHLRRVRGGAWPPPPDESGLARRASACQTRVAGGQAPLYPNWSTVHRQLKHRPGSSRLGQWAEYRESHPNGMSYGSFCARYKIWLSRQPAFLQLNCGAGEWLLVDFWDYSSAGPGSESPAVPIFMAMLGMSGYLYAEAPAEHTLEAWIAAHRHAFSYLGGVPRAVIILRLQPWASNPGWPRQELNPVYEEMARAHGVVILPPATFQPTPAAATVAVLREMTSLAQGVVAAAGEESAAVERGLRTAVEEFNRRLLPGWDASRETLFHQDESGSLRSLPRSGESSHQIGRRSRRIL